MQYFRPLDEFSRRGRISNTIERNNRIGNITIVEDITR
jgi:hypothetical protein